MLVNGTGMRRWFMSNACVTDASRRSAIVATSGSATSTVNVLPGSISDGAVLITGRGPRKR